jgi:hypothetical protein
MTCGSPSAGCTYSPWRSSSAASSCWQWPSFPWNDTLPTVSGCEPWLDVSVTALVAGLVVWHMRRPTIHAFEAAIFTVSLAIVWLGLALAH